jgi:hypothetical protein
MRPQLLLPLLCLCGCAVLDSLSAPDVTGEEACPHLLEKIATCQSQSAADAFASRCEAGFDCASNLNFDCPDEWQDLVECIYDVEQPDDFDCRAVDFGPGACGFQFEDYSECIENLGFLPPLGCFNSDAICGNGLCEHDTAEEINCPQDCTCDRLNCGGAACPCEPGDTCAAVSTNFAETDTRCIPSGFADAGQNCTTSRDCRQDFSCVLFEGRTQCLNACDFVPGGESSFCTLFGNGFTECRQAVGNFGWCVPP